MKSSMAIRELEIALIELEYAAADFSHRKASEPLEFGDFDALLSKLMAANRAVQIAVTQQATSRRYGKPSTLPSDPESGFGSPTCAVSMGKSH
jgi:hypothetical protein